MTKTTNSYKREVEQFEGLWKTDSETIYRDYCTTYRTWLYPYPLAVNNGDRFQLKIFRDLERTFLTHIHSEHLRPVKGTKTFGIVREGTWRTPPIKRGTGTASIEMWPMQEDDGSSYYRTAMLKHSLWIKKRLLNEDPHRIFKLLLLLAEPVRLAAFGCTETVPSEGPLSHIIVKGYPDYPVSIEWHDGTKIPLEMSSAEHLKSLADSLTDVIRWKPKDDTTPFFFTDSICPVLEVVTREPARMLGTETSASDPSTLPTALVGGSEHCSDRFSFTVQPRGPPQ